MRRNILLVFLLIMLAYYWNCLPDPLFSEPVSVVLTDRNKIFLSARIADDGQWRFPSNTETPEKFRNAIIAFEDKRFYHHPGIDVLAICRAIKLNIIKGSVVSGGSTISMQVIRLVRKEKSRTFIEKIIEVVMASRLELKYTKEEILSFYASHAPFGGNIVGLNAASWKYFGRNPDQLSWAEIATLAVLPNAPGLIHPGKNRVALKKKRDRLLAILRTSLIIDSLNYVLSLQEPLPENPVRLEDKAPHLIERIRKDSSFSKRYTLYQTTIDKKLQEFAQSITEKHHQKLSSSKIENIAALIIDNNHQNILAYIGNSQATHEGSYVDMITSRRSTGSVLKPILYSMMLNEGYILPQTLIPDIPVNFGGFTPKNFDKNYEGAVHANTAVSRSLNIPLVYMLNQYGTEKFCKNLKYLGMSTLDKHAAHYGLSLILGGAEASMEDIAFIYSSMAGKLIKSCEKRKINFMADTNLLLQDVNKEKYDINPASIWYAFDAMSDVIRPDFESNWQCYGKPVKVAWKTGTSFGSRDAWAVGCTPRYTIVVWTGNASGEGRPELTGIQAAAPVLFDLFAGLETEATWFNKPEKEMTEIIVCKKSGHRATDICPEVSIVTIPKTGMKTEVCPYHKLIYLDTYERNQVTSICYSPSEMKRRPYFILPPLQEFYYKTRHADYLALPTFKEDCIDALSTNEKSIEILYPRLNSKIYIPVNLDGSPSKVIFQAGVSGNMKTVYWHLDDSFIGETKSNHELALSPPEGKHALTLIDSEGRTEKREFEIIRDKK